MVSPLRDDIQEFAGMGDYGIGVPGARIDAVAEVTPPRGHKAHPRRARRLHVAQIVADVDAVPRRKPEERCGLEQRGRMRLDVRGRVAAHDAAARWPTAS